jgi:hypothetical protein
MAGTFLVSAPVSSGVTTQGGVDRCLVFAEDAAMALEMAQSLNSQGGNANWAAGTATAITAPTDFTGWRCQIVISDTSNSEVVNVTYTGIASDGIDEIGDALVILLNATAPIAGSLYTGATQTLTIAAIADGIGDHSVIVNFFPPASNGGQDVSITEYLSTLTDEGIAAADLTQVFVGDTVVVCSVPVALVSA